jgi:hypothetical protein
MSRRPRLVRFFRWFAILVLLTTAAPGYADESDWYQVEIIVFRYVHPSGATSETWPTDPGAPDLQSTARLVAPGATPASTASNPPGTAGNSPTYTLLPTDQLALNGVQRSLTRSSAVQPILHLGWRMQIVAKDQAIPIHIHGGKEYTVPVPPSTGGAQPDLGAETGATPRDGTTATPAAPPETPSAAAPAADSSAGQVTIPEINGTLLLSRARYLHVWADLVFTEPLDRVPGADPSTPPTTLAHFRMQQHRRMRSGELHYLDHPLFGLLVQVTPYTPPQPPAPATGTSDAVPAATPTSNADTGAKSDAGSQ